MSTGCCGETCHTYLFQLCFGGCTFLLWKNKLYRGYAILRKISPANSLVYMPSNNDVRFTSFLPCLWKLRSATTFTFEQTCGSSVVSCKTSCEIPLRKDQRNQQTRMQPRKTFVKPIVQQFLCVFPCSHTNVDCGGRSGVEGGMGWSADCACQDCEDSGALSWQCHVQGMNFRWRRMKCQVWSVECGEGSVTWKMWSINCKESV